LLERRQHTHRFAFERQFVQLGLIPSEYSGLAAAEHTDIYYQTDGQPLDRQQQESTR